MAIVFPASPSVNETFTAGSITYKWDGDKWIGLGVTPADRLIEGSNSLEIDANNDLKWVGEQVVIGDFNPIDDRNGGGIHIRHSSGISFKSNSSQSVSRNWRIRGDDWGWGNLDFGVGDSVSDWSDSAADNVLSLTSSRQVGIGLTNPTARFHVFSDNNVVGEPIAIFETNTGTGGECAVRIEGGASGNPDEVYLEICDKNDASNSWAIGLNDDASKLCFGYGGKATMNDHDDMQLWSNGQLTLKSQTTTDQLHLAKTTGFGYDPGTYRVLQIGKTTSFTGSPGTNQTLSFNYDPSGNISGSFSGLGSEILVANNATYNTSILQPKTNNVGFNQLLSFGPTGEVRKPSQPSFDARASVASNTWSVNSDGWQKIAFDQEQWDVGDNYNTTDNRFTAPVAGKYLFGCEIQLESPSYSGNPWMYIAFIVNGSTGNYAQGGTRTDAAFVDFYNSYSTVHLMNLAAGDYVEMWRTGNLTSITFKGGSESSFWGYLVG